MPFPLTLQRCVRIAPIVLTLAVIGPSLARACSVPVYRYALEHWMADPYVVIVFHRGELTDAQRELVEQLDPKGDTGAPIANVLVRTVDLDDEPSETILELWKSHDNDTLPLLSLQTPPKLGPPQTAWQGELTSANVERLINSPVRQQLRKRLLEGESVVWLFLESGDSVEDDAAFTLLEEEIVRLQGEIELPAIDQQDLAELSVEPTSLKLAFSALRVSPDDADEGPLREMLLHVEGDLREEPYVNQPMAFPVFGRGRALYALVGDGITVDTIEDASRFLSGACQCTVKAQNPGVDLLMAVDWDQLVTPALPYDDSEPLLAGLSGFAAAAEEERPMPITVDVSGDSSGDAEESDDGASTPVTTSNAPSTNETEGSMPAATTRTSIESKAAGMESLTHNITIMLAVIVAGVLIATLILIFKSR